MVKVKRKRHLVSKLIAVGLTLSLMTQSMEGFLFVTNANELTETEVETNANIISSVNKSDKLEEAIDSKEEEENQKEEKVLNQFKNENINESISLDVEDYSSEYIKIVWENHDESNILSYNVYRNGKFIKNVIGKDYVDKNIEASDDLKDSYIYEVRSVNDEGVEISKSDKKEVYAVDDLTLTGYTQLNCDLIVKNLNITDRSSIYLNGYTLKTTENTYMEDGYLNLEGGSLIVGKDLNMNKSHIVCNKGRLDVGGCLVMNNNSYLTIYNEEGEAYIGGDVEMNESRIIITSTGILDIKGNLNVKYQKDSILDILVVDDGVIIFSGEEQQKINLSDKSYLENVEFRNTSEEGIVLEEPLNALNVKRNDTRITYGLANEKYGWTLEEDTVYEGDLYLVSDELNLNGHKLEVTGSIIQLGGEININEGKLTVNEDYCIAGRKMVNGEYVYSKSNGKLIMNKEKDEIHVNGNFVSASVATYNTYATEGKVYIGGDYIQKRDVARYGFGFIENCQVFFTGNIEHQVEQIIMAENIIIEKNASVNFEDGTTSIKNLTIEEDAKVNIKGNGIKVLNKIINKSNYVNGTIEIDNNTEVEGNYYNGNICYAGNGKYKRKLKVEGTLYLNGNLVKEDINNFIYDSLNICGGEFSLADENLEINKDLTVSGGKFVIGASKVTVGNNLMVTNTGAVDMSKNDGNVEVYGNVLWDSNNISNLKAGCMKIYGDFIQNNEENPGLKCSGNHKIVLCGERKQKLSIYNEDVQINILEITNSSEEGILCDNELRANSLVGNTDKIRCEENGRVGWTLQNDEEIDKDITLVFGKLDLNGHTLRIKGNLIQNGGDIEINGGKLIIDGNYSISKIKVKDDIYEYGKSTGTLKMKKTQDYVLVKGDFISASGKFDENDITDGNLEIKGDIYVKKIGNKTGFMCTKNNTVILSGDKQQYITFEESTKNKARISGIEIKNTSEQGIVVDKPLTITGNIITNNCNIDGTINVTKNTIFEEKSFNGNIIILENYTFSKLESVKGKVTIKAGVNLSSDLEVNDLDIDGGNIYLNGYNLSVKSDLKLNGGSVYIKRGKINIDGNLSVSGESDILMQYDEDYICVNKDVIWAQNNKINFSIGTLEIKGNIYDNTGKINATDEHKLILSGTSKQEIEFIECGSIYNVVEIENTSEEGVFCEKGIPCQKLETHNNKYITGDGILNGYTLNSDVLIDGSVEFSAGTLNLNGHTLTVNGDLIHKAGEIYVNNGKLVINGDYRIQIPKTDGTFMGSYGKLIMKQTKDEVHVKGNIYYGAYEDAEDNLINGRLSVEGNVYQLTYESDTNFTSSDAFCLVLNGKKQQVIFESDNAKIANLDICCDETEIEKPIYVTGLVSDNKNKVNGFVKIDQTTQFVNGTFTGNILIEDEKSCSLDKTINVEGCMKIDGDVQLENDITVGELIVNESLSLNENKIIVKNNAYINGYFYIEKGQAYLEKKLTINPKGYLSMAEPEGMINAKNIEWKWKSRGYLDKGIINISGNLSVGKNNENIFYDFINKNTKVCLTGNGKQIIDFKDDNSALDNIEIKNSSEEGVYFKNNRINASNVITNGNKITLDSKCLSGWKLDSDVIMDDDVYFVADEMDLNGHKLTINGDLNIGSGKININKGQLIVNGNLRYSTVKELDGQNEYGKSYGSIETKNDEDYVFVQKNFVINRGLSVSEIEENGSFEIEGNIVNEGKERCKINGKTILSGEKEQSIKDVNNSMITFENLIIKNTSEEGVKCSEPIFISETLTDEDNKLILEKTLTVKTLNVLQSKEYKGNLILSSNEPLNKDLSIDGDLTVNAGLDLNKHNLEAKDIIVSSGDYIYVNGGRLDVEKDLKLDGSYSYLKMDNGNDYVCVSGSLIVNSSQINSYGDDIKLKAGILEIKGDFIQSGKQNIFKAEGTHTTILSGNELENGKRKVQNISFENLNNCYFNKVILTKDLKTGYVFNADISKICKEYDVKTQKAMELEKVDKPQVMGVTSTTAELKWEAAKEDSVIGYIIYRNGSKYDISGTNSYYDINMEPDSDYVYSVSSMDSYRNTSELSDEVMVHTDLDTESPTKPILTVDTKTGSSVTLKWQESIDNYRISGYELYRDGELLKCIDNGNNYYKDSGLANNIQHKYKIRAFDKAGNYSKFSDEITAYAENPTIYRMTPEENIIGGNKVKLLVEYKNIGNSKGNKVQFEYLIDETNNKWKKVNEYLLGQNNYGNISSYLYSSIEWDISKLNMENVTIRCTVYDDDDNYTSLVKTYEVDREAPLAPEELSEISNNGTTQLTWISSSSEDCKGYKIYRRSRESEYKLIEEITGKENISFVDTNVVQDKTYWYKISAIDYFNQESETTEEVKVIVEKDREAPKVIKINVNNKKVNGNAEVVVEAVDNIAVDTITLQYQEPYTKKKITIGTQAAKDGKATFNFDTKKLQDGMVLLGAIATDVNGNKSVVDYEDDMSTAVATVLIDNTGISKPNISDVIGYEDSVLIKWEECSDDDLGYYVIEQIIDGEYVRISKTTNKTGILIDNLESNTIYTFRIVGYDNIGNRGVASEDVLISTSSDNTPPVISKVESDRLYYNNLIKVNISALDNSEIDRIEVSYSYDKKEWNNLSEIKKQIVGKECNLSYNIDSSAFAEGKVFIKFVAVDKESNFSDEIIKEYVIDHKQPNKINSLVSQGKEGLILLNWEKTDDDILRYDVYRTVYGRNAYSKIGSCEGETFEDKTCKYGTTYSYKIKAIDNAENESDYSNETIVKRISDTQAPVVYGILPANGKRISGNVTLKAMAEDNIKLKKVTFSYKAVDSREDIWTEIGTVSNGFDADYPKVTFGVENLANKEYFVKVVATDTEGNNSDAYITKYVIDNKAPEKVSINAKAIGYGAQLTWDKCKSDDFAEYELYRLSPESDKFELILSTKDLTYVDTKLKADKEYQYKIYTIDEAGNRSESEIVGVIPTNEDNEKPIAKVKDNFSVREGAEVILDAGSSSDNVKIQKYEWDLGNGDKKSGKKIKYTYTEKGTYNGKLLVTDTSGNTATKKFTVKVRSRNCSNIKLVVTGTNAGNKMLLSNAYVCIDGEQVSDELYETDELGNVEIVLKPGAYQASVYKQGYVAQKVSFAVDAGDDKEININLQKGGLVSCSLTQRRLTLDEINALGVDIKDESNWYIYEIEYNKTKKEKINVDKNGNFSCSEGSGKVVKYNDEEFIIITNVKRYLKKMYEVNLTVTNTTDSTNEFVIENSSATLNLPKGLSFVETIKENNNAVEIGNLSGQQTKTASWYIKADEPNTYQIDAVFNGMLMPFNAPISEKIKGEPFTVSGDEENTFTDDGFITGEAKEYSVFVKDAQQNSYIEGARVKLIASDGKKCDSLTSSEGVAKLQINKDDKRVFKLQIDCNGKEETYVDYNYSPDCINYSDCIEVNGKGKIPNKEHKIKMSSANINGHNIYGDKLYEINRLKNESHMFEFSFEQEIKSYQLLSGKNVLISSNNQGCEVSFSLNGRDIESNSELKLKISGMVDGEKVTETYSFKGYVAVVDFIYNKVIIKGIGKEKDVLRETKGISQYFADKAITVNIDADKDIDISKSQLVQGGQVIAESQNRTVTCFVKELKCNQNVYLVTYDKQNKLLDNRQLCIKITKNPLNDNWNFGMGGGKLKFVIPDTDGIPDILKGAKIEINVDDLEDLPLTVYASEEEIVMKASFVLFSNDNEFIKNTFDIKAPLEFILKVNPEENITTGQVKVGLDVSVDKEMQICDTPPLVLGIGGNAGCDVIGELVVQSGDCVYSLDIKPIMGLSAKLGAGVKDVVSGGVYGDANLNFMMNVSNNVGFGLKKISVKGDAGVYVEFLDKEFSKSFFEKDKEYTLYQSDSKKKIKSFLKQNITDNAMTDNFGMSNYSLITDENNYKAANRDYLQSISEWDESEKSEVNKIITLQSSVYTNSKPRVISCNGITMMVFNEDDETRTAENRSRLMYSILNSETKSWSKPIAVKDDKTADYGFDIYDDGKDIYIVWQNADEILKEGYSLSETAKHLGISMVKYDCKEGKMIFLENVADTLNDEQCQMEPHIVSNDGHIYVCWYENSNNNVFGTSGINTIYYKEIIEGSEIVKVEETTKTIKSLDIGLLEDKVYVSYSIGELENKGGEIKVLDITGDEIKQITSENQLGTNVIFTNVNGKNILSWWENNNIKYINSLSDNAKNILNNKISVNDYEFVSDGNKSSIIYTNVKDNKAQAYIINYDNIIGKWGNVVELTNQDKYIENISGTYSDGHLITAFNQTDATIKEGKVSLKKDICFMNIEPELKLTIDDVNYEQEVVPGEDLELSVNVRNAGLEAVDDIRVEVKDCFGKQCGMGEYSTLLLSGEKEQYNVKFKMPYIFKAGEYTINVYNGEQLCGSYTKKIGYTDLSVSRRIFNQNGSYTIQADVTNYGLEKSSGKVVFYNYYDESKIYYTEEFEELSYEEETSIVYNVPDNLISGDKDCIIGIKVVSDKEQINTLNDVTTATLSEVKEKKLCVVRFEDTATKMSEYRYTDSDGKIDEFPKALSRDGYIFAGWYNDNEKVSKDTVFTENTVIVAKWEKINSDSGNKDSENVSKGNEVGTNTTDASGDNKQYNSEFVDNNIENIIPTKNELYLIKGITYELVGSHKKSVAKVVGVKSHSLKNVKIPDMIKIGGCKYKVVEIGNKAFANCKNLRKVTIGKNVKKIGNRAFFKCTKLKKIVIKSKKIKSVKSNSFRKTSRSLIVFVPKKNYATYKKILKKINVKFK